MNDRKKIKELEARLTAIERGDQPTDAAVAWKEAMAVKRHAWKSDISYDKSDQRIWLVSVCQDCGAKVVHQYQTRGVPPTHRAVLLERMAYKIEDGLRSESPCFPDECRRHRFYRKIDGLYRKIHGDCGGCVDKGDDYE